MKILESMDGKCKDLKTELGIIIKLVLESETKKPNSFLKADDVTRLLECNSPLSNTVIHESRYDAPDVGVRGYPNSPLYLDLADALHRWMVDQVCPAAELPVFYMLNEGEYVAVRKSNFAAINYLIEGLRALWHDWNDSEKEYRVREIFLKLGKRGLLDMLGIRNTMGSCEIFPPPRYLLYDTCQAQHSKGSNLNVAARALAKHFHRDQVCKFWGKSTGTEDEKNKQAFEKIKAILDTALWINIHHLPAEIVAIEARQVDGYGARWTADGSSFRGFLEPQMEEGHEVGWRH